MSDDVKSDDVKSDYVYHSFEKIPVYVVDIWLYQTGLKT